MSAQCRYNVSTISAQCPHFFGFQLRCIRQHAVQKYPRGGGILKSFISCLSGWGVRRIYCRKQHLFLMLYWKIIFTNWEYKSIIQNWEYMYNLIQVLRVNWKKCVFALYILVFSLFMNIIFHASLKKAMVVVTKICHSRSYREGGGRVACTTSSTRYICIVLIVAVH